MKQFICGHCGSAAERPNSQYNYAERLGRTQFCNFACAMASRRKYATNDQRLAAIRESQTAAGLKYRRKKCLAEGREIVTIERHGARHTPEYEIWKSMKQRCRNSNVSSFKNYGGRGITVCEQWQKSFSSFLADMGPRPSPEFSLDRIDNDGNYEPGNCRWATYVEQANNRRPACPSEIS